MQLPLLLWYNEICWYGFWNIILHLSHPHSWRKCGTSWCQKLWKRMSFGEITFIVWTLSSSLLIWRHLRNNHQPMVSFNVLGGPQHMISICCTFATELNTCVIHFQIKRHQARKQLTIVWLLQPSRKRMMTIALQFTGKMTRAYVMFVICVIKLYAAVSLILNNTTILAMTLRMNLFLSHIREPPKRIWQK